MLRLYLDQKPQSFEKLLVEMSNQGTAVRYNTYIASLQENIYRQDFPHPSLL